MTNGTGLETRTARPKVDEGDGRDPTRGGLPASRALLFCGVLTGLAFVGRNSNPHFFSIRIFEDYASALVRGVHPSLPHDARTPRDDFAVPPHLRTRNQRVQYLTFLTVSFFR